MIHVLKVWPEPFELIRLGVKTCEVRRETDRRFSGGDVLRMEEFDPAKGYTGRSLVVHVTDLLRTSATPVAWGLYDAGPLVVMSLRVVVS